MENLDAKIENYRKKLIDGERKKLTKRLVKILLPKGGLEVVGINEDKSYKLVVLKSPNGEQEIRIDDR